MTCIFFTISVALCLLLRALSMHAAEQWRPASDHYLNYILQLSKSQITAREHWLLKHCHLLLHVWVSVMNNQRLYNEKKTTANCYLEIYFLLNIFSFALATQKPWPCIIPLHLKVHCNWPILSLLSNYIFTQVILLSLLKQAFKVKKKTDLEALPPPVNGSRMWLMVAGFIPPESPALSRLSPGSLPTLGFNMQTPIYPTGISSVLSHLYMCYATAYCVSQRHFKGLRKRSTFQFHQI